MDIERQNLLLQLRPEIPQAIVKNHTNDIEAFQNVTLRPIIKFLSGTLLRAIKHHLTLFNKSFSKLPFEKKVDNLRTFLEKNQKIRAYLQGMVVGFMTAQELELYFENTSEFNKRVMQMIEQRAVDHLDFF